VQREADAVVGHAILREVVGADLFAAVATSDLCFAFFRQSLLLAFHFLFVKTGAENAHTFFAVLDLRFFVLAADYRVGRQMSNANGRISGVYGLSAGA